MWNMAYDDAFSSKQDMVTELVHEQKLSRYSNIIVVDSRPLTPYALGMCRPNINCICGRKSALSHTYRHDTQLLQSQSNESEFGIA